MKPLLFCALAVLTAPAWSQATLHVPADYPTLQAAIDAAATGDHVLVAPGTYPELIVFRGLAIVVESEAGPEATIIDATGLDGSVVRADALEPDGTTLRGFTLTGGAGTYNPLNKRHYGGAVFVHYASLRVEDCWLLNNDDSRLTFAGGAYAGGSVLATRLVLERCVIAGNFAWASGGGVLSDHRASVKLEHVTVVNNRSTSFIGDQGGVATANEATLEVHDSILWGNTGDQVGHFVGTRIPPIVTYTDVQGGHAGVGNLALDPLFLAPASQDYALQAGSPCIDAGDPASPLDPDGTRTDMGAFAFGQPPVGPWVAGVAPALSFQPGELVIAGQNLELVTAVRMDGVVLPLTWQTNGLLRCGFTQHDPGFASLQLEHAGGVVNATAELWPTLKSTTTGVGGTIDLALHTGGRGYYLLLMGFGRLSTPLVTAGAHYGLLLDPSLPLYLKGFGTVPTTGVLRLAYFVPNDPSLDGLELHFQTYTLHGASLALAPRSYGNASFIEL